METIDVEIKGTLPILLHNGHMADPLNKHAKALKALTSQRKKTDETHEAIAKTEWFACLYLNDEGQIVIPNYCIEAMLISAAKRLKLGVKFKSSVFCPDLSYPLLYDGPKDLNKLWASGNYADRRGVVVSQSRTFRTRPRFLPWGLKFRVSFDTDEINTEEVHQVLNIAGNLIGLCDYRPKFGQFEVVT